MPFNQTFEPRDLLVILLLVLLEAAMSIDNALVLGILAQKLPVHLRKRALSYGLIGAFFFRLVAIAFAAKLLEWEVVKLLGGLYLVYVAVKHLVIKKEHVPRRLPSDDSTESAASQLATEKKAFWKTVVSIELTDMAFAADSILAAIALVGEAPGGTLGKGIHPKLWVVVVGGMLGVILMRFAAVMFIRILEKFPRFEMSAYLLVLVIGFKLVFDWLFNITDSKLNFHSPSSAAFWVFWLMMAACFGYGFIPKKNLPAV